MGRLLCHRDRVRFRWLKGHIGHDLNETADAFARLALRRATGRIPPAAVRREEARTRRALDTEGVRFRLLSDTMGHPAISLLFQ